MATEETKAASKYMTKCYLLMKVVQIMTLNFGVVCYIDKDFYFLVQV